MRFPGGRRWHWAQVVAALICAAALLLLAKSCIAAPGNAPIAHAQADAVTPPAASSGLTETTNTFDLTLSTVGYSPGADTGDYWPRRGLGGPQVITITAAAALNLSGAGDPRVDGNSIPNICRLEARYQYRDGSGAWGNTGAWQTAAWRLWDNHNAAGDSTGRRAQSTYYSVSAIADGRQYSGRVINARLPIAADGSFNGVTRHYRVQARLVYGDGAVFTTFQNGRNRGTFPTLRALLTQILGSETLTYNPACDKVSVDSAARAGNWTTGPSIAPGSITPELRPTHSGHLDNSSLHWFASPDGVRILPKPGVTLNAPPGTDASDISIEYTVYSFCDSNQVRTCTAAGALDWLPIQSTGGFGTMNVTFTGAFYRQLRLRFGNGYGWGAPAGNSPPFLAPSRTPRSPTNNKWLNYTERGLTTWYPKTAGTTTSAVWEYGEGVFLDSVVDYGPPYDDVSYVSGLETDRTRNIFGGIYIRKTGFTATPPPIDSRLFFVSYGPDENIFSPSLLDNGAARNNGYAVQEPNAGHWALEPLHEDPIYTIAFKPCVYVPGEKWDRFVYQTSQTTDWRIVSRYKCAPRAYKHEPALTLPARVPRQVGQRTGVTSYAGHGINISYGAIYTLRANTGSASIYRTDGQAIAHASGAAATAPFYLAPGIYDILVDNDGGDVFDATLAATADAVPSFMPGTIYISNLSVNASPAGQPIIMGANWNALPDAIGYQYEYINSKDGVRERPGVAMVNDPVAQYRVGRGITDTQLRARGVSLDPQTGNARYSNWSSWRRAHIPVIDDDGNMGAVSTVATEGGDGAVAAVISNVLAEINITGQANADTAPVLSVIICLLIAALLFVLAFLATGGGPASAFLALMLAMLFWMGAGPIFFGISPFVAVAPAVLLFTLGGMVLIRRFGG